MTISKKIVDEVCYGWKSSETSKPYNFWSTCLIQACDTILEHARDALQHRLLKIPIKKDYFFGYNSNGREEVENNHFFQNIPTIVWIEGNASASLLIDF